MALMIVVAVAVTVAMSGAALQFLAATAPELVGGAAAAEAIAGATTFGAIRLFKHEYFESRFEKIFQTNYEDAHNAAQKRYPSPLID